MSNQYNFIKPYLRGWIIIVAAMVASYMIASKYLTYVTPMYESTAKLKLADLNEGVPNSNLFKDLDVFASTQKINAEIELIKSHTIIKKALDKVPFETSLFRQGSIRTTELFSDAPIHISKIFIDSDLLDKPFQLSIKDTLSGTVIDPDGNTHSFKFSDTIRINHSKFLISINKELLAAKPKTKFADQYIFKFASEEAQMSEILKNLDVISVDKDVPVIRISYKSQNPSKSALFPNALAKAYIEDYIQTKYNAADVTSDFLNERINEISGKLVGTETAILNYREKEDITNIRQETETDLRKISQLKIQQTNLKMSLDAIKDLDVYMENGKDRFLDLAPNFEAFTDLLSTEMVKKIKQLQSEKKDLLLEYTPKDAKVIAIDHKINDISSYLKESIRNTRKNLESKYSNLVYDIAEAEKVFITVPEKERMMMILNREFEIYQQSYNFLNQKKIEAEIAKAAKVAFHRVITPASVSKEPVSPNRIIIKIVSTILGMIAAIVLIFMVHTMKARVNDVTTVESSSMIPIVAAVPKLKNHEDKENFFIKTLADWEVKDLLKINSLTCFTAFKKSHGADFIAQNLANVLRMQKRTVLYIEVIENSDQLVSNSWETTLKDEPIERMLMPVNQLKRLTTKAWQDLLKEKASLFDYVFLINSVFNETHTVAGMAAADLNIVCLDTRLTSAKLITDVDLMHQEYHLPKMHFAINRIGYNPSLFRESVQFLKKANNAFKNKKKQ
jgi:uncharacterized protein involved in exopolysaccharide biosynthesis